MGNPVIRSRTHIKMHHPIRGEDRGGVGTDVWLARVFIILVLGAGVAAQTFAFAPGDLALLPCPIHSLTGIPCPGCGMTRACIALAGGDFGNALIYNPFSIVLVLFALGTALFPRRIRRLWLRLSPSIRTSTTWSLLVLVMGIWAYRLLQ